MKLSGNTHLTAWPSYINRREFIRDTYMLQGFELSVKYKISERMTRYLKQFLKAQGQTVGYGEIPSAQGPEYNDFIRMTSSRLIVLGDVEIPDHDPQIMDWVISMAIRWDIPDLILDGDIVAFDSFSAWMRMEARGLTFEKEMVPWKETLRVFLKRFDRVFYAGANHERRVAYSTNGEVRFTHFLSEFADLELTNYPYIYVTSGNREIQVMHQDPYSKIASSVPRRMHTVYPMDLVCAHTHRLSFCWDNSNTHWLVEGGHGRDIRRTLYKAKRRNDYPLWNLGFTMILDGIPFLIDTHNIDFWLNDARRDRNDPEALQAKQPGPSIKQPDVIHAGGRNSAGSAPQKVGDTGARKGVKR